MFCPTVRDWQKESVYRCEYRRSTRYQVNAGRGCGATETPQALAGRCFAFLHQTAPILDPSVIFRKVTGNLLNRRFILVVVNISCS